MLNADAKRPRETSRLSVIPPLRRVPRWRRCMHLIAALSLATTAIAEEPPVPLGPSFEVSEDRDRNKDRPRMAALDAGRFVVVWEEDTPSASEEDVGLQGRLFDSVGNPEGGAFQVNAYTTGFQQEPAIVGWPDGRFVVTYSSGPEDRLSSATRAVRARIFDRTGQPVGNELEVSEEVVGGLSKQGRPAVAGFEDGGFVITWERLEEASVFDKNHIVGRRGALDGTLSEPFVVTDDVDGHRRSAVSALAGGGFVVTWETLLTVDTGNRLDVFGRTYDADGEPLGDLVVDEHISFDFWRGRPDVAATVPGEFVVAWRSEMPYESYYPVETVTARRFDASGLALGPPVDLAAEDGSLDLRPRLAGRADGAFHVVWAPNISQTAPVSLLAVGSDDAPRGEILRLGPEDARQRAVDLTPLPGNQLAVAWRTFQSDPRDLGIQGQRLGSPCIPADDVLCLNDGRFRVTVQWRDGQDRTGVGRLVDDGSTDDSGLFWFFSPNNWELLVKLIDGCSFNERFWVFAAAVTDVEYTLRVVDTQTGAEREYVNPLGQASDAVTDTEALAVCP